MVRKLTVRQMGGSVGVTLPRGMADRLHLETGDELFAIERDGGVFLTPYDPAFDSAMTAYDRFSRKYRNALRGLGLS
ncbi:MAG: AbrB/MazE/SpoVT family DNA-binding domain-containing protein [Longimicrobiales bacterium]